MKAAIAPKNMKTNELLEEGIELYQKNDYQNALPKFQQASVISPNLAQAYHYQGVIYQILQDKQRAIESLHQAAILLQDQEYSDLLTKIENLLEKLFPSYRKDSLDNEQYKHDFYTDEDGNWHDDLPNSDDGYYDEKEYRDYLNQELRHLQYNLFRRLKKLERLEISKNNSTFDQKKLSSLNLPIASSQEDLAKLMRISIGQLHFLAFARQVHHYNSFEIPKKTGGIRKISAPKFVLKKIQKWILNNILKKLEIDQAAHGFVPARSIVSNAYSHVKQDIIINLDLQDFFATISYPRVKKLFKSFGYSETVSMVLALLCTEPFLDTIDLDGQIYYVRSSTKRYLPQGAPSSPTITNLLCRNLDQKLKQVANQYGFVYTRYADDLTFSASGDSRNYISDIFKKIRLIILSEGFRINEKKTIIMNKSNQQKVTGVIVNQKVNISRNIVRRFRAILYQIENEGFTGKYWEHYQNDALLSFIEGFANFIWMVNPEKGQLFREQVKRIKTKCSSLKPISLPQLMVNTKDSLLGKDLDLQIGVEGEKKTTPSFLSKSKIINLIYQEFKRLNMNSSARRKYLRNNNRKQSLQELNEEKLLDLLIKLRTVSKAGFL
jgi:retron-type reverse transcriptase